MMSEKTLLIFLFCEEKQRREKYKIIKSVNVLSSNEYVGRKCCSVEIIISFFEIRSCRDGEDIYEIINFFAFTSIAFRIIRMWLRRNVSMASD